MSRKLGAANQAAKNAYKISSDKEQALDKLEPSIDLKAEINKAKSVIPSLSKDALSKIEGPEEIALSHRFSDIRKYANIAYNEIKKAIGSSPVSSGSNSYGTFNVVSKNDPIPNIAYPPKSKIKISEKDPKRIIMKCNGLQLNKLMTNKQEFSKNFEETISKIRGYDIRTENGVVDSYYRRGTEKIPVEIKAYYKDTTKTILGSLFTISHSKLSKHISEEWRYWIYDDKDKVLSSNSINHFAKTQYTIIFYPIYRTNISGELETSDNLLDDTKIAKYIGRSINRILDESYAAYKNTLVSRLTEKFKGYSNANNMVIKHANLFKTKINKIRDTEIIPLVSPYISGTGNKLDKVYQRFHNIISTNFKGHKEFINLVLSKMKLAVNYAFKDKEAAFVNTKENQVVLKSVETDSAFDY